MKIAIKYLLFAIGLFLMGLGVSLTTKSGLGTSPISSIAYVCSMIFPITFGQFTFLLTLVFFVIEFAILGKAFPKGQFFQVFVGPLLGLFVDLGMLICADLNPHFYPEKLIALLFGCIAVAAGVYLQVAANVIVNPTEGLVKAIANKTGVEFALVKIIFDSTLVLIAAATSLVAFGTIKGLREGTLVSAILVGYIIKLINNAIVHFKLKIIVSNYISFKFQNNLQGELVGD